MEKKFNNLVENLKSDNLFIIEHLTNIIDFIRPADIKDTASSTEAIKIIVQYLNENTEVKEKISNSLNLWFLDSRISTNITTFGILSKEGFRHEIHNRFYNKFLPSPPKGIDLKYLFSTLFYKSDDYIWIEAIETNTWIYLFSTLLWSEKYTLATKDHLFGELLYAVEILSIQIASEEFNENFLRLDENLLNRDSAFIELQRSISNFTNSIQKSNINLESAGLDFQHIKVLIEQCSDQIINLKKKSLNKGISISLTYGLERLEQILSRIEEFLELIKKFDTTEFYVSLVELFKDGVRKNSSRNSLYEIYNQNIKILAKSITNNASHHGEQYITDNAQQYIKMFFSASGAGIIIAIMALLKINIVQMELPIFTQSILSSLNYAIGFVLIHMLGLTVATKQPAMTASTFAKAVEKGDNNRANQAKLVELLIQVSRSQFAAVAGNVIFAIFVAFAIGNFYATEGKAVLSMNEVNYYNEGISSFSALIYAAIAGVWLFLSGLIAGYYDNRADYLDLKHRYLHHPFLKKFTSLGVRKKISNYLHDNHGAIFGNFYFGVLLGITPFFGYMLSIPLDIRHVAFSTANLGYTLSNSPFSFWEFLLLFAFVLMIGFVNLSVSFILALSVSLKSRDTYFGSIFSFIKLIIQESIKRPKEFFFPPQKVTQED